MSQTGHSLNITKRAFFAEEYAFPNLPRWSCAQLHKCLPRFRRNNVSTAKNAKQLINISSTAMGHLLAQRNTSLSQRPQLPDVIAPPNCSPDPFGDFASPRQTHWYKKSETLAAEMFVANRASARASC